MYKGSRWIAALLIANIFVVAGCGSGVGVPTNNFPVVVFSDIHFNPFYDPSLFPALDYANVSEWTAIFRSSSISAPSTWKSDTNYPSLVIALASIQENAKASPFVVYTGDLLGHYFPQMFYATCGCQDQLAMRAFTNKTIAFLTEQISSSTGNIPVMFALGNSDSYVGDGPDSSYLADMAELYSLTWIKGTADHQEFLTTFKAGGYYSAEPLGKHLMVLGLNTILFSPLLTTGNTRAVDTELEWLDDKLAVAKASQKAVWLLMHVPPGADISTTAASVDSIGKIANATMMWRPEYQSKFLDILSKYPGVVTLTLAAHTHMDEYRVMSLNNILEVVPSISPYFGNNPAFKAFTFTPTTFKPMDYSSFNYDLATNAAQFTTYYSFSKEYKKSGPLDSALTLLTPELLKKTDSQALYRNHYYSGHNTSGSSNSNSITDRNWPVYACGAVKIMEDDFVNCVNSY